MEASDRFPRAAILQRNFYNGHIFSPFPFRAIYFSSSFFENGGRDLEFPPSSL